MEYSVFRLLVGAIVTITLLFIFFTYFMPWYFPEEHLIAELKDALHSAEIGEGKLVGREIWFKESFVLNAVTLDTKTRTVAFNCNKQEFCCFKEACGKAIVWDERILQIKKPTKPELSVRCYFEELFICKIFLGEKPAQVKIEGIEFKEEVDLGRDGFLDLNVIVKNEGKLPVAELKTVLELKKKKTAFEKEEVGKKGLKEISLGVGEKKKVEGKIEILNNGEYDLYIKIFEEQDLTNFAKARIEFKAIGGAPELGECKATEKEFIYNIEEDGCAANYYCEGCKFAFLCAQKWSEKIGREVEAVSRKMAFETVSYEEGKCVDKAYDTTTTELSSSFLLDYSGISGETGERIALITEKLYENYKHLPYVWGGENFDAEGAAKDNPSCGGNPPGVDCSGLIYRVFQIAGLNLPGRTVNQFKTYGDLVYDKRNAWNAGAPDYWDASTLERGDILFFGYGNGRDLTYAHHIGIYIGNGQMISSEGKPPKTKCSAPTGGGLRKGNLSSPYWDNIFSYARRIS